MLLSSCWLRAVSFFWGSCLCERNYFFIVGRWICVGSFGSHFWAGPRSTVEKMIDCLNANLATYWLRGIHLSLDVFLTLSLLGLPRLWPCPLILSLKDFGTLLSTSPTYSDSSKECNPASGGCATISISPSLHSSTSHKNEYQPVSNPWVAR